MYPLKNGTILHGKSYDYKIVKTLGQGTFGITYLASVKMTGALGSLDLDLLVAVKEFFMRDFNGRNENSVTYSSKDGAFSYYKSKFINEAKNLSNLHNKGIIKVIELFEENQTAYYVMEYVSHGSLDEQIKVKGKLSSEECVAYTLQIAEALDYMHQNKMLHLDLKPNNIMVGKDNKLVLIDFGLSKRFDAYGKPETSTTIGHGTPGYAPVEQANYQGSLNGEFPSTMDVYALGGTMFKMLTGHRPPEASVILNEGFPITELESVGVAKQLSEIVAHCMEPRRKNRYKNATDVINVLSKLNRISNEETDIPIGYYKRKKGEREYGGFEIENVPVTSAFEFPEYINIRLWDNSRKGKSCEVIMTDVHFEDGCYNLMRIWDKGDIVDEHEFLHGIPNDVKSYLISHGFLSNEHWENECETSPIDDDFGTDASITMIQNNGDRFERRVKHAHKSYHNLLLDELIGLLTTTSLKKELKPYQNKRVHTKRFTVPFDTSEIIVSYEPSQIGPRSLWREKERYYYSIREHSECTYNKDYVLLDARSFQSLLDEIEELGMHIGAFKQDIHDHSEIPGKLDIKLKSGNNRWTHLSLVAFNTDMQGGNIYRSNIIDLAQSIHRIILKYLIKIPEPTRELIYSIPDTTSAILIDYIAGGIVGLSPKPVVLSIVNSPSLGGIYDPDELSKIINGLRNLKLRAQNEIDEESSNGVVFPRLSLSFFDNQGNILKAFYAQDNGDNMIGSTVITVKELKDKLSNLSKSFKDRLAENEQIDERNVSNNKSEQRNNVPIDGSIAEQKVSYNWTLAIISFVIGSIWIFGMKNFVHTSKYDFNDLDTDGWMLVYSFGLCLLGFIYYLLTKVKQLTKKRWNLYKCMAIILFCVNTLLLTMWNYSLTMAYVVLSAGLLLIVSILLLINKNKD